MTPHDDLPGPWFAWVMIAVAAIGVLCVAGLVDWLL